MIHQQLGRSGLIVSRVCLGTMNFGNKDWGIDREASRRIIHDYLDAGGNFLDTADMYAGGVSEEILGEVLAGPARDGVVLATKCWFRQGAEPNARGLSRRHIINACEASLRRLRTDRIDLYQFHGPDPLTPIEESAAALADLVRAGKVRYAGLSNFPGWQVVRANAALRAAGNPGFIAGQYLYNLLRRDIEREVLPACRAEGLGVICWSPLASGFLSGKYRGLSAPPAGSRFDQMQKVLLPRFWNAATHAFVERLHALATGLGESPVTVALAWLLAQPGITSVITGANRPDQLAPQLRAPDLTLSPAHLAELTDALPCDLGYPDDWMRTTRPAQFPPEVRAHPPG